MDQQDPTQTTPLIADTTIAQVPVIKNQKKANCLSRLFFCQVYPIIKKATIVSLENQMIPELDQDDTSEEHYSQFQKKFEENRNSKYALTWALIKTYQWGLLASFFVLFIQLSLDMCLPLFIKAVIEYIQEENKKLEDGIKIVSAIFISRFVSTVLSQHNVLQLRKIGNDANTAISVALIAKCLNVSLQSNKQHKSGEVLNLMQVDTRKIQWMPFQLRGIFFMPIQIAVAIYLMFDFIGISFLAGIAVIILTTICNLYIGKLLKNNQKDLMVAKDKRTKCANELFSSIKFIKMNALEEFFIGKLKVFRDHEMKILTTRFIYNGFSIMSIWMSPVLVVNATFAMYIYMGGNLDPQTAFAMISLFQVLQGPLIALPMIINSIIEAMISMNRLQKFLLTNEIMTQCIENVSNEGSNQIAIGITNGSFYWKRKGEQDVKDDEDDVKKKGKSQSSKQRRANAVESVTQRINNTINSSMSESTMSQVGIEDSIAEEIPWIPILKNINIEIKQGEFIAIVGDVGAGKTSLLQGIIGEMIYEEGPHAPKIQIQGSIAYVSQKAWIQNATVKDNILFGQDYDEKRYNEALMYSCLTQDLEILIKGDQTEIGEKGVNLSGGQKARISLARAIYSDCDIYLLDDPISAVDVHVGKFIMHKCLQGILKSKTRILVTHAINYTQFADRVFLMENGSITEQGTFAEIRNSEKFQIIYNKFYRTHEKQQEEEKTVDVDLLQINLEKKISIKKEEVKKVVVEVVDIDKPKDFIDQLMIEEDRKRGQVEMQTFIQYFRLTGGLPFFLLITFIQVVWIFSRVGSSIWLAMWTQEGHDHPNDVDNKYYLNIYSSFSLIFGLTAFLRAVLISINNVSFAQKIHNKMVNCLTYAPQCSFFERVPLGRIMNRFTKDQNVLDSEINWNVSGLYVQIAMLIGNSFLNVYASTVYMLIPIFGYFIFAWWVQRFYMHANRDLYRLESISKSPILSYFGEILGGLPVIRAFSRTKQFTKRHAYNLDQNRKIFIQQNLTGMWFSTLLSLSSFFINISAIVFCIFYSNKNPAYAGLLLTYASSLDTNIQSVIYQIAALETSIISFERCLHYTEVEPEKGYKKLVDSKLQDDKTYNENSQFIPNWPGEGKIQFEDYAVQYRENLPTALRDLSFVIQPNEKIGVVGRTGAGKSTMTLTLLRVLEAMSGKIIIDGVDISQLSLKQLRESITMIMQDSTIFEGSMRDNIDPLKTHTNDEVLEIIESCCLSDLINKRQGLDTKVTENGENLSAGEKQLVNIARAVLKRSKIVLIDEATANIDIQTEQQIQETILKGFQNCTVITIAHRITTILNSDKILVIDQGKLVEFGVTQELIKDTRSHFYGIYQEAVKEQKQ